MTLRFHTLDVFTSALHGGNPLAVVFGGDGLSKAQQQRVAREFNLSETVFVLPATVPQAAHRLRIYTPARELPFAGHPTVGTACLLAELGLVSGQGEFEFLLEEGVGLVPLRVRLTPGEPAYAELTAAKLPEYGPPAPPAEALAEVLGLDPAVIGTRSEQPRQVSCGLPFVLVPLAAPEQLAAIDFNAQRARELLAGGWAGELYVYAYGYEGELRARMFAPGLGIGEDPATGSAAAALAGALASEAQQDGELRWELHQGVEMNRPSLLSLRAERRQGHVQSVHVGGYSVRVSEGQLLGF
ncbi:PhzF family phenazine biosynthesis protein [Solimonas aquatica]|nr:PhzF family phenazine biosynthesis protein [Solimonas aquatica]